MIGNFGNAFRPCYLAGSCLFLFAILNGCFQFNKLANPPSSELIHALNAPSISFRDLLKRDKFIRVDKDLKVVFRTEHELNKFMSDHPPLQFDINGNPVSLPAVDFSNEQSVLVVLGPEQTGGISVEITSIEERSDRFIIHSVRWLPPPGQPVTSDIGYPLHYVAMKRSTLPVEFAQTVDGYAFQR